MSTEYFKALRPAGTDFATGKTKPVKGRWLPLRGSDTCGTCDHHFLTPGVAGRFHKCDLNASRSLTTDLRVPWPACTSWVPEGER